jgi:hypothetical protein
VRRDFILTAQRRVAMAAIGPSALRGQRHPELAQAVRDYLARVPLKPFGVTTARLFNRRLDECTDELLRTLPAQVRHWGIARKSVNLFLRDALYNRYLCERFNLVAAEAHYEIPLDRVVAKGLSARTRNELPAWQGVKYLTRELSQVYQALAGRQATRMGIARIHLDLYLWTARSDAKDALASIAQGDRSGNSERRRRTPGS